MKLPWALALLVACGTACEPTTRDAPAGQADPPIAATVQRFVAPAPGTLSTALLPRATIGSETRPVLGNDRAVPLRWKEEIELTDVVVLPLSLPAALANRPMVRAQAWISVAPLPDDPKLRDIVVAFSERQVLRADPVVSQRPTREMTLSIEVPPALRGETGLLYSTARALPDSPSTRTEVPAVDVPPGASLEFGFGIEREAWHEAWPPVRFSVSALAPRTEPVLLFERRIDPATEVRDRRWFDVTVPLTAFTGRSVGFAFESAVVGDDTTARSLPVFSNPQLVVRFGARAAERRNIVLVSLDTLRARSLSAYGRSRRTSPAFDGRMAGLGVLMGNAITPAPFTPPSHMTMMTGLEPCMHGVRGPTSVLAPEPTTLAEHLQAAGYRTAAFTENAYVVAGAGFERGFDRYHEERSDETAARGFAALTFERGLAWLDGVDDNPFFLFVHTYQVHSPYEPPRGYELLYEADGLAEPRANDQLVRYEREIRYTDDLLGQFLDDLEVRGLADDTLVVVTSDHGEAFGEHGFSGHGVDMSDGSLRVPLALRAPGLLPSGQRIDTVVGLVDLTPTLLELVGLDPPPQITGRSFAGLLTGTRSSDFDERGVVSETAVGIGLTTRDVKYLEKNEKEGGLFSLYRLDRDPEELDNVAAKEPGLVAQARSRIAEHRAECERWRAANAAEQQRLELGEDRPTWLIDRDEIDQKLRSLGYIE